jgi:hypothetical protein
MTHDQNIEHLRTEVDHADDTAARMDDRLRQLGDAIDTILGQQTGGEVVDAVAWARLVRASLDLDERLQRRARELRIAYERARQRIAQSE